MENLEKDKFKINVYINEKEKTLFLKWEGILEDKNPSEYLSPYLDKALKFCEEKSLKLEIDFILLEYMNSSSIPPLIHLLRDFNERNIELSLIYDSNNKIQSASFRALQVIADKTDNAKIIGKDTE